MTYAFALFRFNSDPPSSDALESYTRDGAMLLHNSCVFGWYDLIHV